MEAELAIRWLFSPFSTALAAGALFAFCLALWKKRPKQRRNSAPETSTIHRESEFRDSEITGLTKSKSECSFRACNELESFRKASSFVLTNFPAFDGNPVTSKNISLPCIAKSEIRSFSLSDDLINVQRKFSRLQSVIRSATWGKRRKSSCSLPNFNAPTKLSDTNFLGSFYPQLQPFVKHVIRPFGSICDLHNFSQIKRESTPLNSGLSFLGRNFVSDYTIPYVAKNILTEDFYSFQGINFGLRKRKKIYSFSELCWKGPKRSLDIQRLKNKNTNNSECNKFSESLKFSKSEIGKQNLIEMYNDQAITANYNSTLSESMMNVVNKQLTTSPESKVLELVENFNSSELIDLEIIKSDNHIYLKNDDLNVKAMSYEKDGKLFYCKELNPIDTSNLDLLLDQKKKNFNTVNNCIKLIDDESDSDNNNLIKFSGEPCQKIPEPEKTLNFEEKKDMLLKIKFTLQNIESPDKNKICVKISELNSKKGCETLGEGVCLVEENVVVINGTSSALDNCQKDPKTRDTYESASSQRIEEKKSINSSETHHNSSKENLEVFQGREEVMRREKNKISLALETKIRVGPNSAERPIKEGAFLSGGERSGVIDGDDVTREGRVGEESKSRTPTQTDEHEAMDRSVEPARRLFESSVTSETRFHAGGGVSTAVVSSMTLTSPKDMSMKTIVSSSDRVPYRPNFEEYMPIPSEASLEETIKELNDIAGRPLVLEESPPRVSRLLGLLNRDEERKAKAQELLVQKQGSMSQEEDGEWDRILRDVLASVSELEKWGGAECRDVTSEDAEKNDHRQHPHSHSSSLIMEEEVISPTKGETPTKVKNLRFKLDPDIFDVPSDDSFYDDDVEEDVRRPAWRRQARYRVYEAGQDEPVKLVSVHASVVPAGQKMIARPVGIDLRVRLTEERHSKRAHVGTSPSQAKRRSPVSDTRWCQELSPVTENVDWREAFSTINKDKTSTSSESKPMPNGILKTPSPKTEAVKGPDNSSNPFKGEVKLTNGSSVTVPEKRVKPLVTNGVPWRPPPPLKKLSLPRKKFEPDPEAIDRITGYKVALSKPPIPPSIVYQKNTSPMTRSRAEMARKQYLDSKNALAAAKTDGSKKFQQFLSQAQTDRARIVTSVPDLVAIERAVNERWAKERGSASPRESPAREENQKPVETPSSRGSTPDDAWASYVQSCRKLLGRRSQSMSYLETEVDLPVIEDDDKWRSTSALGESDSEQEHPLPADDSDFEQSREDLDDSGRAKSEHELRVQRSLQSLPLPDWYKRSDKPKSGFLLKSSEKEKRGWAAAKSLASSTSSLASCGVRKPVHSLRSSRENIPWSRGSASPDGPSLSLALARAFREPYLGWRSKTSTSSGISSSPRTSPPSSWCAATTDDEANGISFDGEDAFGRTSSEDGQHDEPSSVDDTGADAVTVSMDTGDVIKLPSGEDTCDDINNMSMDTCELFDASIIPDVEDVNEPSPQADTGDSIDNLSTDTTDNIRHTQSIDHHRPTKLIDNPLTAKIKKEHKLKRYSYSQSIYHSEWDDLESRGDRKARKEERNSSPNSDPKVIWIESSFVGSRTTTSIVVLPEAKDKLKGNCIERPASR